VPASKVLFVPNGVDDWMVAPAPSRAASPSGDFEVVYCGAHGPWNGLGQILDAAALLAADEHIRFTFIGDGEDRKALEERAVREGLTRVRFLGTLAKKEAFARLTAAAATVVVTWDHPFQRMVLANKIFDYLAASRPVVVAAEGEMAALVREAEAGLVVPPGRPEELAAAIRRLAAMNAAERDAMGRRGRQHILAHYRRTELAGELLRRFDEVLGRAAPAAPVSRRPA
jgi:glycosyltransferase involved in cell wall biosynthesis